MFQVDGLANPQLWVLENGAEKGAPKGNDGEQTLSLLLGVNVVRKGPELRDHEKIKNADR